MVTKTWPYPGSLSEWIAQTNALRDEVARLRAVVGDCAVSLDRAGHVHVPEDAEILALCERFGFGAVMDSASRQWLCRDPVGAFTVGPCGGTVRAVLAALEKGASGG